MSMISRSRISPSDELPSSPPRNGLTKYAPALATIKACGEEKTSVMLTRIPSLASTLSARTPSGVMGILTTMVRTPGGPPPPRGKAPRRIRGYHLGVHNAIFHNIADLQNVLAERPFFFGDQSGIGCYSINHAQCYALPNFFQVS